MTRCLLLLAPREQAPVPLLAGLARRAVTAVVVADPPSVMLQLSRGPAAALIIIEPQRQPYLSELVEAVRTYHPRVRLWQYRGQGQDGQPQLARLNGLANHHQAEKSVKHPSPPPPQTAAAAQAAWHEAKHQASADPPAQTQAPSLPLISAEELAMLLGDWGGPGGMASPQEAGEPA